MFNPFNKKNPESNAKTKVVTSEEEFHDLPYEEGSLVVFDDIVRDRTTIYLDYSGDRILLGGLVFPEILEDIKGSLTAHEEYIEESKRNDIVAEGKTSGKIELEEGKDYTMTIYGDTSFSLPLHVKNDHAIIHTEIGYNHGHIDLGTKWKTTSTPINAMGIYFIAYKFSKYINDWVATIELVSD